MQHAAHIQVFSMLYISLFYLRLFRDLLLSRDAHYSYTLPTAFLSAHVTGYGSRDLIQSRQNRICSFAWRVRCSIIVPVGVQTELQCYAVVQCSPRTRCDVRDTILPSIQIVCRCTQKKCIKCTMRFECKLSMKYMNTHL